MEENECLCERVCVGVSALRVNLFFQTPLNYGHITLPGEGQGECVIMTAKQVFDGQGVCTRRHMFSAIQAKCVFKFVQRLLL